jgi:hypothetical protein
MIAFYIITIYKCPKLLIAFSLCDQTFVYL